MKIRITFEHHHYHKNVKVCVSFSDDETKFKINGTVEYEKNIIIESNECNISKLLNAAVHNTEFYENFANENFAVKFSFFNNHLVIKSEITRGVDVSYEVKFDDDIRQNLKEELSLFNHDMEYLRTHPTKTTSAHM